MIFQGSAGEGFFVDFDKKAMSAYRAAKIRPAYAFDPRRWLPRDRRGSSASSRLDPS
jgi:hypothetical protein